MSKWVIDTVELIKKQYVIDAYLPDDALELRKERAPDVVEVLSDTIYDIHAINEYEYNKEWKPRPDYNEGHDYQQDWVSADKLGTPAGKPEDDEPDLYRDD